MERHSILSIANARGPRNYLDVIGLVLSCFALLGGVFVIPFAIPPSAGVISASALAGYNNTAAYGLYLLLLVLAGWLAARVFKETSLEPNLHPGGLEFSPSPVVWLTMAVHIFLFAGLYLVKGHFVFMDALYFQHILARMGDGAVPYRDINFLYGPAMLYPPFWLSSILGVTAAYATFYVMMYLTGLYFLYLSLQLVTGKTSTTDSLYLLFGIGFFNHTLGLNYVFARALLPAAAVFAFWRSLEQPTLSRFLGAVVMLFCAFAYSPEMGTLASCAIMVMALSRVVRSDSEALAPLMRYRAVLQAVTVCVLAVGGMLIVFYAMDPSFQALKAFLRPTLNQLGGAGNRPIYFNLPILGIMIVSVMALALSFLAIRRTPAAEGLDLVLAMVLLSLLMQRMAFGVPDSLHVVNNCMPLFLLGVFMIPYSWRGIGLRKWYCALLILTIMLPLQVFNAFMFKPFVERHLTGSNVSRSSFVQVGSTAGIQASLAQMIARIGPERTYYLHGLQYYSLPVVLQLHLKQVSYFTILEEAQVPTDYQEIIREIRASNAIVVTLRKNLQNEVSPEYGGWEGWLYQLTASPLPGSRIYSQLAEVKYRLSRPLLDFMRSSYGVLIEQEGLVALVPQWTT